jgi:hypothetical protein
MSRRAQQRQQAAPVNRKANSACRQDQNGAPAATDVYTRRTARKRVSLHITESATVSPDNTNQKLIVSMLSDVASPVQCPSADASTVCLVISGMYDANTPVSWSTVELKQKKLM